MIGELHRLPQGVKCSSANGKISVSGIGGTVVFKSRSDLYYKGGMVLFLPDLTSYEDSLFRQAVRGVLVNYSKSLKFKGIGYKAIKEGKKITLHLGHSLPIVVEIPDAIKAEVDVKNICLTSPDFGLLQNFAMTIRSHRAPDCYKAGGVLYEDEVVICKEGKKT